MASVERGATVALSPRRYINTSAYVAGSPYAPTLNGPLSTTAHADYPRTKNVPQMGTSGRSNASGYGHPSDYNGDRFTRVFVPSGPQSLALKLTALRVYYRMQAWDLNALVWRVWVVTGTPDPTALHYTGTYGGGAINFETAFIAATWES